MDAGVGGQLQGISLDSFLQMVQMEKTTCTLKVVSGKQEGTLFINKGELIAAETQNLQNFEAACAVISWDNALIEIDNTCTETKNEINQPLMHVLMEGLKLKDEKSAQEPDEEEATLPSEEQPSFEQAEEGPAIASNAPWEVELADEETEDQQEFELHVAPKPKKGRPKIVIVAVLLLIAGVAVYFTMLSPSSQNLEQAYQNTLSEADLTADPKAKIALLQDFIATAGEKNQWTDVAEQKIIEIRNRAASEAYQETAARADAHLKAGEYKQAATLYTEYLGRYANSSNANQAKAEIVKFGSLAEQADYEGVVAVLKSGDVRRIEVLRAFVKNHPNNDQVESLKQAIADMEKAYFAHTEKQIAKSALVEDWANCSIIVATYAEIYPDGSNVKKLNRYLPLFEKNRLEYADYEKIMVKTHEVGTDYAKAQKILSNYLKAFPGTHLAGNIEEQITHYKKLDEETKINERTKTTEILLKKSKGRFTTKGDGTFTDTRTGRMWCTLDSRSVLDNCLNYNSANAYIKALNTGGHRDWRLPSPGELKTLLQEEPYFPATESQWLWTSKILKKYVGEWLIDVTVVTTDNNPESTEIIKDSRYCGNVRAVRR